MHRFVPNKSNKLRSVVVLSRTLCKSCLTPTHPLPLLLDPITLVKPPCTGISQPIEFATPPTVSAVCSLIPRVSSQEETHTINAAHPPIVTRVCAPLLQFGSRFDCDSRTISFRQPRLNTGEASNSMRARKLKITSSITPTRQPSHANAFPTPHTKCHHHLVG